MAWVFRRPAYRRRRVKRIVMGVAAGAPIVLSGTAASLVTDSPTTSTITVATILTGTAASLVTDSPTTSTITVPTILTGTPASLVTDSPTTSTITVATILTGTSASLVTDAPTTSTIDLSTPIVLTGTSASLVTDAPTTSTIDRRALQISGHGKKPPRGVWGETDRRHRWVWETLRRAFIVDFTDGQPGSGTAYGPIEHHGTSRLLKRGVMDQGGAGVSADYVATTDGMALRLVNLDSTVDSATCEFLINNDPPGNSAGGPRCDFQDTHASTFALVLRNRIASSDAKQRAILRTEPGFSGPTFGDSNSAGTRMDYTQSTGAILFTLFTTQHLSISTWTLSQDQRDRFEEEMCTLVFSWDDNFGCTFYFNGENLGLKTETKLKQHFGVDHIYIGAGRPALKSEAAFSGDYSLLLISDASPPWTDVQAQRWSAEPYGFLWPEPVRPKVLAEAIVVGTAASLVTSASITSTIDAPARLSGTKSALVTDSPLTSTIHQGGLGFVCDEGLFVVSAVQDRGLSTDCPPRDTPAVVPDAQQVIIGGQVATIKLRAKPGAVVDRAILIGSTPASIVLSTPTGVVNAQALLTGTAASLVTDAPTTSTVDSGFDNGAFSLNFSATSLNILAELTPTALGIANTWTWMIWCKSDGGVNDSLLKTVGNSSPHTHRIDNHLNGTKFRIGMADSAGNSKAWQWGTSSINVWNQAVVKSDGSAVQFYLNGVEDTSPIQDFDSVLSMTDDLSTIHVGSTPLVAGAYDGKIYLVAGWNVQLSDAEVAATYNGGDGRRFDLENDNGDYVSSANMKHLWATGRKVSPDLGEDLGTQPIDLVDLVSLTDSDRSEDAPE